MRNQFKGNCYVCKKEVVVGGGHFQRHNGMWLVKHAGCHKPYEQKEVSKCCGFGKVYVNDPGEKHYECARCGERFIPKES